MAKQKQDKSQQTEAKSSKTGGLGLFLLLLLIGMAVTAFVGYQTLMQPFQLKENQQSISIKTGDTYSRLIDRIATEQNVKFPIVLKLYQKMMLKTSLKAGIYEVKPNMNIKQVLDLVSNAKNVQLNRITVVEGTNFKQLVQMLKKDSLVTNTILDLPAEQILPKLNIPYSHPEGLFAPNTYFYQKGETDVRILTDLYQRQQQILQQEWAKRDTDLPYKTPYEALIMASIIDKESNVDAELAEVSGVFYRRLKIGMKLQTDPTVIYGMGDRYQGNITKQDLRTPTAYNTYTIYGLPPTPIALPSQKAIHAALHPNKNSKTLYFVATGKGGHKFSETLEQHNQAVAEYLAVIRGKE